MMKSGKTICLVAVLFVAAQIPAVAASYLSSFPSFGSGCSESSSPSYRAIGCDGLQSGPVASRGGYRNYAGTIPAQTVAPIMTVLPDENIEFIDPSPAASEVQQTTAVDFCVTVQITGGNTINDFSYQVSTWGVSGLDSARSPLTNASTDTITTAQVIRYRISFPNSNGTVFLAPGENNYIRCYVNNNAGGRAFRTFQIKVSSSPAGAITILQPDEKSGVASIEPYIKAELGGTGYVDPSSIRIKLEDASGATVLPPVAGTYDASRRTVSYKYDGPALVADATYKVTVTAGEASDSVTFKVKGGAIADLVPYPSPFDPQIQPVTIRYALNRNADVTVNIYDRGGRLVRNVINNEARAAGIEEETWDGANYAGDRLANGVYFCELIAKDSEGEHRRHTALALFGR